jgi:hypothetical protein
MSFTVGLDFGTHQTKVCIEDSHNPLLKRYTFFPFEDLEGKSSFVLPSVVQINKDDTLSYGFVEAAKAKVSECDVEELMPFDFPDFEPAPRPVKPALKPYPSAPKLERRSFSLSDLASLIGRDRESIEYKLRCKQIDEINLDLERNFNSNIKEYEEQEQKRRSKWEQEREEALCCYQEKAKELESRRFEPYRFRYFKTAALGDNRYWDFDPQEYNPRLISVLYLAYVLYQIEEDFGSDTYVQMGVPQSLGTPEGEQIAESGYCLLILARVLTEKWTKSEFLKLTYPRLLRWYLITSKKNTIKSLDIQKLKNDYGVNMLPEAYAGLVALTAQKRIPNGFSLLVDIGGGTTDIALFTLANDRRAPDIAMVVSVKGGLNSVIHKLAEESSLSMDSIQKSFVDMLKLPSSTGALQVLSGSLQVAVGRIITALFTELQALGNTYGPTREALADALNSRPIYYCGGGGVYSSLRVPISHYFSDVRQVSLNEMGIQNLTSRVSAPYDTILAVSYGLSILSDLKLESTSIIDIFKHLRSEDIGRNFTRDYND